MILLQLRIGRRSVQARFGLQSIVLILSLTATLGACAHAHHFDYSSEPRLTYSLRIDPDARSIHVTGTLRGVPRDSVTTWGQQPHQYMAARGRPDTILPIPGGIRFAYVVRPEKQERDNTPDAVIDSLHLRAWGATLFAIPVLSVPLRSIEVNVELPRGWRFASTFANGSTHFRVPSPQALHASAFLAGSLHRVTFSAGGVPVELATRRELPIADTTFRRVLHALLDQMRGNIGPLPVERVWLGADYRGERKTNAPGNQESTAEASSTLFTYGAKRPAAEDFAGALAHELSHMWIPGAMGDMVQAKSYDALGPFFVEGFTNYLGYRLAYDAELLSEEQLAHRLSHFLLEYNLLLSPAGAQWRGALPYSHGLFAALILDVELVRRSSGEHDFYNVVRRLVDRTRAAGGRGVTPAVLDSVLAELGGPDLPSRFAGVRSTDGPVDFMRYLEGTGIMLRPVADPAQMDRDVQAGKAPDLVAFDRSSPAADRFLARFLARRIAR